VLGVVAVLVAGSIWRRRAAQELEHLALPEAAAQPQPQDRP
jgi:hypothetical protein